MLRNRTPALAGIGMAICIAAAAAQGPLVSTNHVIGFADEPLPLTNGFIDIQDIDNNCQPAKSVCKTLVPVRAAVFYGGGTAYDARYQSVWVSEGSTLNEYGVGSCQIRCRQIPVLLNPNATVSGLAIADRKPRLFQLATMPGYMEIVTYDNSQCPPKAADRCSMQLGGRDLAAGLAYDELSDLLFWTVSSPLPTGGFTNTLMVAPASSACKPLCKVQIMTNCSREAVLGLAYDACKKMLYATDGQITESIAIGNAQQCSIKHVSCCKKQTSPTWRGLCLVPGWRKGTAGKPCFTRPCPSCPNMSLTCTGGDPVLGNPNFALSVTAAPTNSIGVMIVGIGGCTSGLPFGCGMILPPLAPAFFYPATVLAGSGSCTGAQDFPFPIPPVAAACSATLCAQTVVFCPTSTFAFGNGLTNAIQFQIAGG